MEEATILIIVYTCIFLSYLLLKTKIKDRNTFGYIRDDVYIIKKIKKV